MKSRRDTGTPRIIRRREVCERVGVNYTTIWRWEKEGLFPRRVQLNPAASGVNAAVGWLEHEVDDWIRHRIRVAGTPRHDEAQPSDV
jgi:prophage regulatory protein